MPRLFLSPNVYLSLTNEGAVFLDINQDQYVGLGVEDTSTLMNAAESGMAKAALTESIDQLMHTQILTRNNRIGRPICQTVFKGATRSIEHSEEDESDLKPQVRGHHVAKFLIAYGTALLALKCGSLRFAIQRAKRRSERRTGSGMFSDVASVRELVRAFRHLGPIFFRARDNCLLDSMALMEFLALYDLRATWIFGVKTAPFQAHCWVEHDEHVLSSPYEYVAMFKPIMVV